MPPRRVEVRTENDVFQHVETLRRNRHKRRKHGEVFVEGVRSIDAVLAHGWPVRALVWSEDAPLSGWAEHVIEGAGAEVGYVLPAALMARLSRKDETSELLAIVRMPEHDLSRISNTESSLVVVLDRPARPGNLGTIVRSCDALGVDAVVLTGHGVDPYDPEAIAASAGSLFAVPIVQVDRGPAFMHWLQGFRAARPDLRVVGTSAASDTPVWDHDFRAPTLLLVGNETHGLSRAYRELADTMLAIPMPGSRTATSLNVACATTAVLLEITRQRASAAPSAHPSTRPFGISQ